MKISKLALIALVGSALTAFGCGSSDSNGGSGGGGGAGGTGGSAPACADSAGLCENGTIDPITVCCDVAPPVQENACDGSESLVNPTSCTPTGVTVTHLLTVMEVAGDCNVGYDLDSCNGDSCDLGALAPDEGVNGVDNALAGLAPVLTGVGGNLDGVNQAFSDSLCGLTDDPAQATCDGGPDDGNVCVTTCEGGANAGNPCTQNSDCPDGTCADPCTDTLGACSVTATTTCTVNTDCPSGETCEGEVLGECNSDDDDCMMEIPPIVITLAVDANAAENCANVKVTSGGVESDVILNVSDPTVGGTVCASGTIGTIPVSIGGVDGAFGNAVVRTTVSATGFSDGLLGMTVDSTTAVAIAEALLAGAGQVVGQVLDINEDLSGDSGVSCNALSATFAIGGVAQGL